MRFDTGTARISASRTMRLSVGTLTLSCPAAASIDSTAGISERCFNISRTAERNSPNPSFCTETTVSEYRSTSERQRAAFWGDAALSHFGLTFNAAPTPGRLAGQLQPRNC